MTDPHTMKIGCISCKSTVECKGGLSDETMMREGWERINGCWYCDECAPYRRKKV